MTKVCEHNNIMIHKQEYQEDGKLVNQQRNYPEGTKFQYYLICTDCVDIVDEITEEQAQYLINYDDIEQE
jgi:predicted enzyme related to lactoylglutathione lyase